MRALVQQDASARVVERPVPQPGAHEVLVRVHAGAMNRADLAMLRGQSHGSLGGAGTTLGLEWAGRIAAVGPAVRHYRQGDRVMCTGIGGFAEYAVTDARRIMPIPSEALTFEQSACLPVALTTMHDAIVRHGRLARGQTVLVQGASTSVGLMGLQICRRLGAALVIGSSTSPERRARLAEFGADLAVDSRDPAWPEQVLAATQGRGVDLVVDQLSGSVMNGNLRATAVGGTIVNVGRLAGPAGEFDFALHALRRIRYTGVTFRTRAIEEIEDVFTQAATDLGGLLQQGLLRLPIDSIHRLEDALIAYEVMGQNKHFGKILLSLAEDDV